MARCLWQWRNVWVVLIAVLVVGVLGSDALANRFWIALGNSLSQDMVMDQLVGSPASLKVLGRDDADGWSVGYYEFAEPLIFRGASSAFEDTYFDRAVFDSVETEPTIIFAHLRNAVSGCVGGGILNPYPFERLVGEKTWVFGHDGYIEKSILLGLIDSSYLEYHSPDSCNMSPPTSWIDSELYFLFLLQSIEKMDGDVAQGLISALRQLRASVNADQRYLNFFLTNGENVWVYREGNPLFYRSGSEWNETILASSIPDLTQEGWRVFPEGVIGYVELGSPLDYILLTPNTESE